MPKRRNNLPCCACSVLAIGSFLLLAFYLLAPFRTNLLILGIDHAPRHTADSRTDTIILTTFIPLKPYIGMLSIPRDLWVNIPGVGENRINTAHYFAEIQKPGSGPYATMEMIRTDFGVNVHYYLRINFEGLKDIVDAMGGVDINLPEPMAGYESGTYHLTGNKALAFARHRMGEDDFFRMSHGQLLMKAMLKEMISPIKLLRLPLVLVAIVKSIDTNLPFYQIPRLGFALLRTGPGGIDTQIITRDMATPFTTAQGASVLQPNWPAINVIVTKMFGK